MIDSVFITAGLAASGVLIWLVRLEGRVNSHDTTFVERGKMVDVLYQELTNRIVRIETKLDESLRLNGNNRT